MTKYMAIMKISFYRVLHKFEEKSDLGQPRSDLGWTLVGPRFGQGLTKMVRPRGPLTSGLTSEVPLYKGFKEGRLDCHFV
jgi:hypothetical protein